MLIEAVRCVRVPDRERETDKESQRKRDLWKQSFCTHPVFKKLSIPTSIGNFGYLWAYLISLQISFSYFFLWRARQQQKRMIAIKIRIRSTEIIAAAMIPAVLVAGKGRTGLNGLVNAVWAATTLGLHSTMNYCAAFNYSFGCPLLMTKEISLLSISLNKRVTPFEKWSILEVRFFFNYKVLSTVLYSTSVEKELQLQYVWYTCTIHLPSSAYMRLVWYVKCYSETKSNAN